MPPSSLRPARFRQNPPTPVSIVWNLDIRTTKTQQGREFPGRKSRTFSRCTSRGDGLPHRNHSAWGRRSLLAECEHRINSRGTPSRNKGCKIAHTGETERARRQHAGRVGQSRAREQAGGLPTSDTVPCARTTRSLTFAAPHAHRALRNGVMPLRPSCASSAPEQLFSQNLRKAILC